MPSPWTKPPCVLTELSPGQRATGEQQLQGCPVVQLPQQTRRPRPSIHPHPLPRWAGAGVLMGPEVPGGKPARMRTVSQYGNDIYFTGNFPVSFCPGRV